MPKAKAKRTTTQSSKATSQRAVRKSPHFEIAQAPTQQHVELLIDETAELQRQKKELEEEINKRKTPIKKYLMAHDMRQLQTYSGNTATLSPNTTSKSNKELAQEILDPATFVKLFKTVTDEQNPKLTVK